MNLKLLHDDVIKSVDDDQFGHQIYADTLKSIIEAESPGVISVGLFGKWGQGKSSIVEILKKSLQPNINPVVFNAWQVRGDRSIRRQLILELIDKTCSPKVYDQMSA